MSREDFDGFDANARVGMDFIALMLLGFVAMVILIIPYIAVPGEDKKKDPPPQGNVIVEVSWPDAEDIDVDLWVQAPGDMPVGYSNLGGVIMNLLRDDLGTIKDVTGRNMEIQYSRGIPNGEYVVNLHLYALKGGKLPVPCRVTVSYKRTFDAPTEPLFFSNVELKAATQELTVFRFTMRDSALVAGSLNRVPKAIRPFGKG